MTDPSIRKHIRRSFIKAIIIATVLLALSVSGMIHLSGLANIFIVYPFWFVLIIMLARILWKGYKNKVFKEKWYQYQLGIYALVVLISLPMGRYRTKLDWYWRKNNRELVVEDIKSGELLPFQGRIAVPFEKYGRVSFDSYPIFDVWEENVVLAERDSIQGWNISFMYDKGYFSGDYYFLYTEYPDEQYLKWDHPKIKRINEHWSMYRGSFSLIRL